MVWPLQSVGTHVHEGGREFAGDFLHTDFTSNEERYHMLLKKWKSSIEPDWWNCVQGMVNVAAVDCDDASMKSLCGKYGVQGFPTLKVSRQDPNCTYNC